MNKDPPIIVTVSAGSFGFSPGSVMEAQRRTCAQDAIIAELERMS